MKRKTFLLLFFFFLFLMFLNHWMEGSLLRPISHGIKEISSYLFWKEEPKDWVSIPLEKEYQKEIQELKEILSIEGYDTLYKINASTIFHKDILLIDKGVKEGIEVGLPVVVKQGLVGIIEEVGMHTSSVSLLSKKALPISVKIDIQGTYIYGVLSSYDSKTNSFQMTGISENQEIPEGSLVTTSGMGSRYPNGIFIGTTTKVEKDHFDLTQTVKVKSEVPFSDISYVTVLKKGE